MNRHSLSLFGLLMPLLGQAAGMGITVPYNITETERISYSNVNLHQTTYEYKPSSGLGFVFDTNIGKDRDFSYRLNLEYTLAELEESDRLLFDSGSKHKYNIVNTFGFSVYHSRYIRLWAGPRVNVQYQHLSSSADIQNQNSYGVGIGVATGLNVHLGSKVSLGADIDYHGVYMFGGENYQTSDDVTHYTALAGSNKGATARVYLLLRFGEQYAQKRDKTEMESVIDHTL